MMCRNCCDRVLVIPNKQLQVLLAHAQQSYPEECCGLLIGRQGTSPDASDQSGQDTPDQKTVASPSGKTVIEAVPVANRWSEAVADWGWPESKTEDGQENLSKRDRYWIDPKDLLRLQRSARERNLDIIGVYHSHPNHPAVPSDCDRTLAWSGYSYVIVSVQAGKAVDYRSWCLDDHHQFQAEPLTVKDIANLPVDHA